MITSTNIVFNGKNSIVQQAKNRPHYDCRVKTIPHNLNGKEKHLMAIKAKTKATKAKAPKA